MQRLPNQTNDISILLSAKHVDLTISTRYSENSEASVSACITVPRASYPPGSERSLFDEPTSISRSSIDKESVGSSEQDSTSSFSSPRCLEVETSEVFAAGRTSDFAVCIVIPCHCIEVCSYDHIEKFVSLPKVVITSSTDEENGVKQPSEIGKNLPTLSELHNASATCDIAEESSIDSNISENGSVSEYISPSESFNDSSNVYCNEETSTELYSDLDIDFDEMSENGNHPNESCEEMLIACLSVMKHYFQRCQQRRLAFAS